MIKPYYEEPGIVIYNADCRDVLPQLEPGIDLVLTDPTYKYENTNYASRQRSGKIYCGRKAESRDWGIIAGSDKTFSPEFLLSIPQVILWGGNYFSDHLPATPKWLIWDKRRNVPSDDNADCEMAWTNLPGVTRIFRHLWKGICREGEENIAKSGGKLHPFQKPLALMKWCINQAHPANFILDPFMGSGTTLVAAKSLGRKCIGIEIEEKYVKIAIERLRQGVLI